MRVLAFLIFLAVGTSWAFPLLVVREPVVDDRTVAPARFATADLALRTRLDTAKVTWGTEDAAGFTGSRWVSGREPWLWVGSHRGLATTNKGPEWRPCIWAHAAGPSSGPNARTLRIEFADVPAFSKVYGEAAILDVPREGGPVELRVQLGSQRPLVKTLNDARGERRWVPYEAISSDEGTRAVTFEISASSPDWRQVCFTAFVTPGEKAP